jgi:hypothetical protein
MSCGGRKRRVARLFQPMARAVVVDRTSTYFPFWYNQATLHHVQRVNRVSTTTKQQPLLICRQIP